MKKLYIIAFAAEFICKKLVDFFDSRPEFGNWFYSMPGSVFVYSHESANTIRKLISESFPGDKRIFVAEVEMGNFSGYIPQDQCDIISRKGAYIRYDLKFNGYFVDVEALPMGPGVFCVYRSSYNSDKKTVSIKELLYIGQKENVHDLTMERDKLGEWGKCIGTTETLCYSVASLSVESLKPCEAALIYLVKPLLNQVGKDSYGYRDAYLSVSGAAKMLPTDVVAYGTNEKGWK